MPPQNPVATPAIPAGATVSKAASKRYTHDAETLAFKIFLNVDRALWQQLLGAVRENFVRLKHRTHRGYRVYITLDLLNHLYDTYFIIYNADCLDNEKLFCEEYAPTNPIQVVWRQIDEAVTYTNAVSTPYLPKKVVDNAYHIVFNLGIFAADCRERNKRAATDNTLPHLKFVFAAAHREWRLLIKNEMGAPYGAAHNATANLDNEYLQKYPVDAIANLATSTASDCVAISQLTSTVGRLTAELATVNAKLVIALQKNRDSQCGQRGRDRTNHEKGSGSGVGSGTGTGAGSPERTGASAPTMAEKKDLEPPIHYCWTCGPGCRHNSAKCPVPAAGNIYTTTKRNIQRGAESTQ